MNPVDIVVAQMLIAATLTDMLIVLYAITMNLETTKNSTIINRKKEQCSKVHPLL